MRDEQFEYINKKCLEFHNSGDPVISIDAKKKEKIGDFKPNGVDLFKKGEAPLVLDHDYVFNEIGKATPYGVYDIFKNLGFVNVGVDNDTAEFSANSIRVWWNTMGKELYPNAKRLLITSDSGGSNGYRLRLWKVMLQELSNELGLEITMLHFPPGTSKWNKIEHKLFSFISKNWRGKILCDYATIVNLIDSTKTSKGLVVKCVLDTTLYEKGIKITDEELNKVEIRRHDLHPDWNYTIEMKKSKENDL